jgi:D-sedoheptulose 7-phosphate isomerase
MTHPVDFARQYLVHLQDVIERLPILEIGRLIEILENARRDGRHVFVVGNGGSAATASHMMTDLGKGTLGRPPRRAPQRLRVIALTDNVALLTAWANDTDYAEIFSEPLRNLATRHDLLIAVSASGRSPNILRSVAAAKEIGMTVIALTGFGGGELSKIADLAVVVPSDEYGPVEDIHLVLNHIVAAYLSQTAQPNEELADYSVKVSDHKMAKVNAASCRTEKG